VGGNLTDPRTRHRGPRASDPLDTKVDALHSQLDDGPCITALRDHHTVHIDDMSQLTPWPKFAKAALELGVRCSLSLQPFVRD
jgi:hypothetical protein